MRLRPGSNPPASWRHDESPFGISIRCGCRSDGSRKITPAGKRARAHRSRARKDEFVAADVQRFAHMAVTLSRAVLRLRNRPDYIVFPRTNDRQVRHSRERGNPVPLLPAGCMCGSRWIPAFAGMTSGDQLVKHPGRRSRTVCVLNEPKFFSNLKARRKRVRGASIRVCLGVRPTDSDRTSLRLAIATQCHGFATIIGKAKFGFV
jgi:hypothetical protein